MTYVAISSPVAGFLTTCLQLRVVCKNVIYCGCLQRECLLLAPGRVGVVELLEGARGERSVSKAAQGWLWQPTLHLSAGLPGSKTTISTVPLWGTIRLHAHQGQPALETGMPHPETKALPRTTFSGC